MNKYKNGMLETVLSHPRLVVLLTVLITAFFAFQLPKAELDNNNIRFVPENDEARLTSNYIDETFGSSLFILVGLERKYGDVFDPAFLNRIREFNRRMEDFEIVGNVNSIVSSDYIYAEKDPSGESAIVVRKLAEEDFSGTQAEIADLKRKLLSWDIYRRALISDDFSATQILIPLTISDEAASRPEVIDSFSEIRDTAKEMFSDYAEVYVTGLPIISATINESMRADLITMIPLVVLVVLVILFFSFKAFTMVILPLITVLVSVVCAVGAMPLFGIKLSVVSSVLPVILVAVGSAYGIHIVTHYLEETRGLDKLDREEHRKKIVSIVRKIGKAVFLAALTTLAGFSSFCFTTVLPIREFGFFSTAGVLVSFLTAIFLIPSLLILRGPTRVPLPAKEGSSGAEGTNAGGISAGIARLFTAICAKKGAVLFAAAGIVLVSVWGISKVVFDNVLVEYFKSTSDIARSDRFIREKFGGSKVVSVVAEADKSETLLMPDLLSAMDKLGKYLEEEVPEAGKVMGFTDLVKRINQVFNAEESPDGLSPAAPSPSGEDSFGFGDFSSGEFGFGASDSAHDESGDFGFASFDDAPLDDALELLPSDSISTHDEFFSGAPPAKEKESLSAAEIIGLLKEAASSGKDRFTDVHGLIRGLEKIVNYEGAAYYEIPEDPERYGKSSPEELSLLVSNYLILLSGSIGAYANDPLSPTAIKTTVQLRTLGDEDTGRAIGHIREFIGANFPKNVKTLVGGSALVESSLTRLIVESQLSSVIISVLLVFLIVAFSNRSAIAGLVGIAPLSISILVNFAVMGFLGIKLNIGTSMVASVSVGIGIDYTIHYIEAYKREYIAGNGSGDFLLKTFSASGKAILINAVSVGAGFAVLLFSQFIMLKDLGLLIAITMASSALVSLTVIPVLLLILKPKFISSKIHSPGVSGEARSSD